MKTCGQCEYFYKSDDGNTGTCEVPTPAWIWKEKKRLITPSEGKVCEVNGADTMAEHCALFYEGDEE